VDHVGLIGVVEMVEEANQGFDNRQLFAGEEDCPIRRLV
jgi:hypothetical protein